jgi:hypothetical protein
METFVCVYCHCIVDLAENYISLVDSEDRMARAHPRCQDLAEVIAASHPPKKPPLYICVPPSTKTLKGPNLRVTLGLGPGRKSDAGDNALKLNARQDE